MMKLVFALLSIWLLCFDLGYASPLSPKRQASNPDDKTTTNDKDNSNNNSNNSNNNSSSNSNNSSNNNDDDDDELSDSELELVLESESSGPQPHQDNKNLKIGIIGGGPAGLAAARLLSRAGYNKVTVMEASSGPAGFVRTRELDGQIQDFSTRYVPGCGVHGAGFPPMFQQMIDEYNLQLSPLSTPIDYVIEDQQTFQQLSGPLIYSDLLNVPDPVSAAESIVADLIWGFEALKAIKSMQNVYGSRSSVLACRAALGIAPGTTWQDWVDNAGKPGFSLLAGFTNDLFLGGPAAKLDACVMLSVRVYFMPSDIVQTLQSFGVDAQTQIPISPELREALGSPTCIRHQFDNGYISLFDAIVANEDFEFIPNARVESIKRKNARKLRVKTEAGMKRSFHRVIVATRSAQTLQFLQDDHSARQLLSLSEPGHVHVHAFHTSGSATNYPNTPATFTTTLYPAAALLGTPSTPFQIIGVNKEFETSGIVSAIGYVDKDTPGDELQAQVRAQEQVENLGFVVEGEEFGEVFEYPDVVSVQAVRDDWNTQMEGVQGEDEMFFVGELVSGFGVPVVIDFVESHLPDWFDLVD